MTPQEEAQLKQYTDLFSEDIAKSIEGFIRFCQIKEVPFQVFYSAILNAVSLNISCLVKNVTKGKIDIHDLTHTINAQLDKIIHDHIKEEKKPANIYTLKREGNS